ncbi:Penicillin-binding protein 2 [Aquicella siphonis]|uniref:Peptidoglycan D,D-transpeptidase MrdA n=1 Tax=Aquicella siphonis TaxID=254247 RepID=A0A5E4PIU3_9COXI|nr:penicillin-binding protein 2 [Aquicella siphonis]VVC76216.1 Penicillin-binding protein 2 [Aquicella siphonis]
MHKRISIKNHYHEIQLIVRRSMLALLVICLMIGLLIFRLAYLQIYKNELYTTLSTKNAIDLVPVEPTRGLIYDRKGILLAENIPVFSLDIIPQQVSDLQKTLAALDKIIDLSDSDISQFKKQLKQHRRFDEIPLKLRLSDEEVARFTENQYRFPGVLIRARLMRRYPYGESFAHVLGYVGRINTQELNEIDQINYSASHYIGKLGIEKFYEDELHGKVGYEEVENDASGKPIRVLKKINGLPGKNIYLTIDSGLQFAAEKALQGHRGAIVAIQPKTGQVLAMVSQPSYDPNLFVLGISQKDYNDLQHSEDKPLYDRALRGLYPLASTIKPYLALEGLQSGIANPEYSFNDPGWFKLPNSTHIFHDWRKNGHGRVNLPKAIAVSCDIFFYELASKMGIQRIDDILTQFGYGALTGIDLNGELAGIVASPEWKRKNKGTRWYPGDTVISSIGQGDMQATPLQLASAVATMSNRGKRFMPYLRLGEQMPGREYIPQQPVLLDPVRLTDEKYWDIVINAMQDVVASPQGTAYSQFGRNYSYTIAAKTGTAALSKRRNPNEEDKQENVPERLRDHHLFVAFAPVENPKIALAIITENSNNAIEAARAIFDYYLGGQQRVDRQSQNQAEKART